MGEVAYETALATMEEHRKRLISGDESAARVMLLEHPPVVTLGRHAQIENIVWSADELERRGIALHTISRGGDVTYHGPGQLMIYPVLKLNMRIGQFLEGLAMTLSSVAKRYGAAGAEWRNDPAGLWVGDRKLAACGLHIQRGVCIHGFAFNVATPPDAWHAIVPCGLVGTSPISLAEIVGHANAPSVEQFAARCKPALRDFLGS